MEITISVGDELIEINTNGLIAVSPGLKKPDDREYTAALNGIQSLLLALACEGVNVATRNFAKGVQTAIETITNEYDGDEELPVVYAKYSAPLDDELLPSEEERAIDPKRYMDVCVYDDPNCTKFVRRYTWFFKGKLPRKDQKTICIYGVHYSLRWVD